MHSSALTFALLALGGVATSSIQDSSSATQEQPIAWAVDVPTSATARPEARLESEIDAIANAAIVLNARGFEAEAARLREIVMEMTVGGQSAERLLAGDIQDRAVRVEILELAARGYDSAGWETSAEALDWFTAVGKSQVDGTVMPSTPIPKGAQDGNGSIMDRMIELVLGAAPLHQRQGNEAAANACLKLGRFYIERDMGKFRDAGAGRMLGRIVETTPETGRLNALGYGGDVEEETEEEPAVEVLTWGVDVPMAEGARIDALRQGVKVQGVDMPMDESARIDALRREVERLRREVQEMKSRLKR